jgi:hypothetical protein
MSEVVPQTGGYMVAAYIVTAVILVGYSVLLARRTRKNTSRHI